MVEMAQHGNVKPNDKLWHPQYPDFVIANQVQGLFQSSKPITPATSVCPQCGKDDKIQKVSSVYSGGFSTAINNSPLVAYGVEQRTITTITPLAQRLAPPAKPKLTGCAATSPVAILIVAAVLSLILFCVLFPSLAWESSGANSWANCIFLGLMFIVMMAIGVPIGIYSVKKQKELHPQIAMWEKAIQKWNEIYYCWRDDSLFDPASGKSVPSHRMSDLLY